MSKNRVAVYVDGLSLYHSLNDWVEKSKKPTNHYIKWLDLRELAEKLCEKTKINRDSIELVKVCYFSAYGGMRKRYDKSQEERSAIDKRHKSYVKALKKHKVECEISHFTFPKKTFPLKHPKYWIEPKEKETDVKLTIKMLEDAFYGNIDTAILISADSDFTPLLKRLREKYGKRTIVAITKNRIDKIKRGKKAVEKYGNLNNIIPISLDLIEKCQLPDRIKINDNEYLSRPEKYQKIPSYK